MESYVIRIYRRNESEPERVVGLVEHPENGAVERFSGVAELVNILLSTPQTVTAPAPVTIRKADATSQSTGEGKEVKQHKTLRFRSQ
jgi:hypothetical protein